MTHALELAGECLAGTLCVVAFFMALDWLLVGIERRNDKEDERK